MTALAAQYDCVLLDLDGVLYRGPVGIPGAAAAVSALGDMGIATSFVTNNASRAPGEVASHLVELGIAAAPGNVVTSAQAGAHILSTILPSGSLVYVVGGVGIESALAEVGLHGVRTPEGAAAVIQGFGPEIRWSDLAEAAYLVQSGVYWIATNMDTTFPTERGIAPGNGSLVRAVEAAAGREPDAVAGKPAPALGRLAIERAGATQALMVGDRYDTDIAGGMALGIPTYLVLTGVTTRADVWRSTIRSTYIAETLEGLLHPYVHPTMVDGAAVCGRSSAHFDAQRNVVIASGGEFIESLRAAEEMKWNLATSRGIESFALGDIGLRIDGRDVTE